MNHSNMKYLRQAVGDPLTSDEMRSRAHVRTWFVGAAPLIQWDVVETPIGPLYLAISDIGLCRLDFNEPEERFIGRLDPMAHVVRDPRGLSRFTGELGEYFAGKRQAFDVPIDWRGVGAFQRSVLEAALHIPAGSYWTYQQVAQFIGKPKASRAVGQALARNPVAIFVPCHRVLASDGSLHGYAGGLERKQALLQLEGAV
jgi:methylated-DNA-[protein]-cysteine S-methyltransferase